ncbi:MAG: dihydropteroate synthase [candidate division Zixibacteria bacterium]|nr:dihydropteroate synthase [candidate division Zixibacteria bacterium]
MTSLTLADGRTLDLSRPLIMGIINCTPDSFAVQCPTLEQAVGMARQMIAEGADILDLGGESSRPGSMPVPSETELARVIPVIESIRGFSSIPISIDTGKAAVAEKALTAGANIINDITALAGDPAMAAAAVRHNCPVVLMHIKGTPKTMQIDPRYDDVIGEVSEYFEERMNQAREQGVAEEQIILDVGIGFGKRLIDNLTLVKHLHAFARFGRPLMVGLSRKRFIGDLTGADASDRLPGSLAAAALAVSAGAHIIRTHDVAPTKQAVAVAMAVREA